MNQLFCVAFAALIENVFILIIIIAYFKYRSSDIFLVELFSISILTLGIFTCIIFLNENDCFWGMKSMEIITILTLYNLNGVYLLSLPKFKCTTLLINLSMAILIALIAYSISFNSIPYIVVAAFEDSNIKHCRPEIYFNLMYFFQSMVDVLYIIKIYMLPNRNVFNNIIVYTTCLLLISHAIAAVVSAIEISYTFTIICQSIFILFYFDIFQGDNNTNILNVNIRQQNIPDTSQNLFTFNDTYKSETFDISHKYVENCFMVYNVLLSISHPTGQCYLHHLAIMIAEYAATTYTSCVECDKRFPCIECYKDYALYCGAFALFDGNDNVLYFVNAEPSDWSECRKNDTLNEEMEILCVNCATKWKCSICSLQTLTENYWEIDKCAICKSTVCGNCSRYDVDQPISDYRVCKRCDDKEHSNHKHEHNDNDDPKQWKFDELTFE